MEKEIKTCKTCIYWGVSNRLSPPYMAKCTLSMHRQSPLMFSACGLITRSDFGCVLHKDINGHEPEKKTHIIEPKHFRR